MKILFVNHTSSLTGAPISCLNIMTRLGNGFLPVFATKEEGPVTERLKELGIAYYTLEEKGFLGFKYISKFIKIIKSEKIDILHLNTLTPFCKYAGIAGFLLRIPVVWFVRENPMISRSKRLKFWLKHLSNSIVFVDHDTKNKLLPDFPHTNVIYNGVDMEIFKPSRNDFLFNKLNIDTSKRLIGYIGLITERKGIEYLIRAMPLIKKNYSNIKLILIGGYKNNEYEYYLKIKRLIEDLSLKEDIYFIGAISSIPTIRDAINSLDIIVLPSLEERCSRSLLESLACGKAVVATRVGGTPEIIDDGINGILVEPMNEIQIADAVLHLLNNDDLRINIGKNARIKAERFFDIKDNIKRIRELYLNLFR
ncbi:MAG: glycosyltransferase family 4 protein [Thermodesulfovibrionales bacterium]